MKKVNKAGQATVEFILTFILIIGIMFLYVQLSLGFTWANFIHYATFMSSRALLAGDSEPANQGKRAYTTLVSYIKKSEDDPNADKFPQLAKGIGGENVQYSNDYAPGVTIGAAPIKQGGPDSGFPPPSGARQSSWAYGASYNFEMRLFLIPFTKGFSIDRLNLKSESFLGREPTTTECINNLGKQGTKYGMPIYDNGC